MSEQTEPRAPARPTFAERQDVFIWALIGFVPGAVTELAVNRIAHADPSSWTVGRELGLRGLTALCLAVATLYVARRQDRPLRDFGVPLERAFGLQFWFGAFLGVAMLFALLVALSAAGDFEFGSTALAGETAYLYAIAWAFAFLFVSISEELAFRGYILAMAARRIGFWRAAFALSIGFAVSHLPNRGETALGILHTFGTALLFCFSLRRTGSLWFAFGYHASWDWGQSFLFGTPDSGLVAGGHYLNPLVHGPAWLSGGSVGPEGSVLAIPTLLLAALLVHLTFPKVRYPTSP